jgi:hypothetical protein
MKNEQNHITETKAWAIEKIIKLHAEEIEVAGLIHHQTMLANPSGNFNLSRQELRLQMITAQIEQLKEFVINN